MGLSQVPEGRRVILRMSVLENLEMGHTPAAARELEADLQMVFSHFPRLKERVRQLAGTLSGGEQQMLATARALMSHPTLLMMDEPSMGLSPILVEEIFGIIRDISRDGTTILLVEQNAQMALSIASRAYVLETGRIVMEGDAKTLLDNEKVRRRIWGRDGGGERPGVGNGQSSASGLRQAPSASVGRWACRVNKRAERGLRRAAKRQAGRDIERPGRPWTRS